MKGKAELYILNRSGNRQLIITAKNITNLKKKITTRGKINLSIVKTFLNDKNTAIQVMKNGKNWGAITAEEYYIQAKDEIPALKRLIAKKKIKAIL